jgi:hypothetical protein
MPKISKSNVGRQPSVSISGIPLPTPSLTAPITRKEKHHRLQKKILHYIFHTFAFILILGATSAAIVNRGIGWDPNPELISNQFYDATILRFVKHLVDNPQVKLPFLLYEGAVWLKSTTAAHVLWSIISFYFGVVLPRFLESLLSDDLFVRINRVILLSTLPALFISIVLHVFITPIPPPRTSALTHGDWLSGYLQRMLPSFLGGWSLAIDRRS